MISKKIRVEYIEKAIKIAQMGLWNWNPLTNEVTWSNEKFELFGYEPQEFEVNMETAFKTVFSEDIQHIGNVLEVNLPSQDYFEYSYRGVKKQGDIIHVWVRVQVERNDKGEPIMIHGISQDRTQQIKLENEVRDLNRDLEAKVDQRTSELMVKIQQNEFLVKEMHHRVKNNLQVISSILKLQKGHISDTNTLDALDLCVKRIKSMALIHDSLFKNANLNQINLVNYVNELVQAYGDNNEVKFELNIEDKELGLDIMIPIGLILNELIANSCLHAFHNIKNASISIDLYFKNDFILLYNDNGNGINKDFENERPSFGMEMIKTLCEGINGHQVVKTSQYKGFGFELRIPKNEFDLVN